MPAPSLIQACRQSFCGAPSCMMTRARLGAQLFALFVLGGCAGARYERPIVPIPPAYREDNPESGRANRTTESLGELRWQDLIHDEALSGLIQEAIADNFDVQAAASRVLQASAQLTIARSALFPLVNAQGSYNNSRFLQLNSSETSLSASAAWDLDLWGQVRNAGTAARANLLATEQARRVVLQTLVSGVVGGYFLLQDLDLELDITRRALQSRRDSLDLVRARVENGYSSELDLRQAEVLVETARTALTGLELQIEQTENQLDILLGRNPGPIVRSRPLLERELTPQLPPGLPSTLLDRRPDIRQAEEQLIAAHALVAVARAAYFPNIALTSSSGFESSALHNLFSGLSGIWSIGPAISLPIFNAGSIHAGVRSAQAQQDQAVLVYRKAVQEAFREVADSLVEEQKLAQSRTQQQSLVDTLQQAVELADLRYQGGFDSYLDYLDSERQLLDAQVLLVQLRRQEMTNVVNLYQSLGGGWR